MVYEIKHYGIPDQTWHNRRFQNEDGTYTELGKARLRAQRRARHDYDDLSNDELQARINRLKKENKYVEANKTDAQYGYEHLEKASKIASASVSTAKTVSKIFGYSGAGALFDIAEGATGAFSKSLSLAKSRNEIKTKIESSKIAKKLSDEQLDSLTNRLNLENSYRTKSTTAYENGRVTVDELISATNTGVGIMQDVKTISSGFEKLSNSGQKTVNNLIPESTKKKK